ncbi:hypothetical protein PPYR_08535, partial [Photinus pyralis]
EIILMENWQTYTHVGNSEGIEQNRATGNYIKVFYLRALYLPSNESSPCGLLHKTKLHFVGTN